MQEVIVNLHMHTRYSDGSGSHRDIVNAAFKACVDVVIVTDHNVLVQGFEGYYREKNRRLLMLIGEEVHDQDRDPQKNHMLVFGANRLPELGRGLGKAIRGFKDATHEDDRRNDPPRT